MRKEIKVVKTIEVCDICGAELFDYDAPFYERINNYIETEDGRMLCIKDFRESIREKNNPKGSLRPN
jgi:hypothetical protein